MAHVGVDPPGIRETRRCRGLDGGLRTFARNSGPNACALRVEAPRGSTQALWHGCAGPTRSPPTEQEALYGPVLLYRTGPCAVDHSH